MGLLFFSFGWCCLACSFGWCCLFACCLSSPSFRVALFFPFSSVGWCCLAFSFGTVLRFLLSFSVVLPSFSSSCLELFYSLCWWCCLVSSGVGLVLCVGSGVGWLGWALGRVLDGWVGCWVGCWMAGWFGGGLFVGRIVWRGVGPFLLGVEFGLSSCGWRLGCAGVWSVGCLGWGGLVRSV